MNSTRRTNRLERETSPYLLQHAFNPVDWSARARTSRYFESTPVSA
jgi:uncharacterized protein YyaL (SSP411 family)